MDEEAHFQRVLQALDFVAAELDRQKIPWLLGASGALMVWGVKVRPFDLDVFVGQDNVIKLEEAFRDYVINTLHNFNEGGRNYLEFQMKIFGVEIEICELDFGNEKFCFVDFQGRKIPVNPLEKELEFYQNRPGKEDLVGLIKERLKENNDRD
jgi:hypothetical protein